MICLYSLVWSKFGEVSKTTRLVSELSSALYASAVAEAICKYVLSHPYRTVTVTVIINSPQRERERSFTGFGQPN